MASTIISLTRVCIEHASQLPAGFALSRFSSNLLGTDPSDRSHAARRPVCRIANPVLVPYGTSNRPLPSNHRPSWQGRATLNLSYSSNSPANSIAYASARIRTCQPTAYQSSSRVRRFGMVRHFCTRRARQSARWSKPGSGLRPNSGAPC